MTKTLLFVVASVLPLSACGGRTVIVDQTIPHELAEPVRVTVWARNPEGRRVKVRIALQAGDYVASALALTGEP